MFEQALFIRPNSSAAHTGLGYVALEKGRPQLAAEHFLAATRAGNDEAWIGLGDAYRRLGRPRDALRAYQSYLTRSPNGRQISIAQAQIDRLTEELNARKSQ
jgi:tetratricopeptide (TPR) repeat protein